MAIINVLDLGSGTGDVAMRAEILGPTGRVVALARNPCMLETGASAGSPQRVLLQLAVITGEFHEVELKPDFDSGMAGRQLRMRMVTIEPGGVFGPIHDHKERPGTVYILQGTITDHRDGEDTEYGPGLGWPEDRNTLHWLENTGTIPAVEISVDIVRQQ